MAIVKASEASISTARQDVLRGIVHRMCSDWSKGLESGIALAEFFSDYHQNVEWYDHAFQVHRIGIGAANALRCSWLGCNRPLVVEAKNIHFTSNGVLFEQTSTGTFSHDLVRPDGDFLQKASGKDFCFRGIIKLTVNAEGLIIRVDEWYTRNWDESKDEHTYRILQDNHLPRS